MLGYSDLTGLLFRFVGWGIIPHNVTIRLMPPIHKYALRRPITPGTPAYQQMYRYTYAFVIMAYLSLNLGYAAMTQAPNYYQLLGVGLDADEGQLKTAFRNFAKRSHPDKAGEHGVELFMRVRIAYEALKNPVKRFAYDRFGSAAFDFEHCITEDEYLHAGLLSSSGFYITTLFFMIVYGVLGEPDSGAIWRYLGFLYLLFCELALYYQPLPSEAGSSHHTFPMKSGAMTFPLPITIIRWMFPNWIPFQLVTFLHEVFTATCIAIARVLPVVWPDRDRDDVKQWIPTIHRMFNMVQEMDQSVHAMIRASLTSIQAVPDPDHVHGVSAAPFPDQETMMKVKQGIETSVIDSSWLNHPMLQSLWRDAVGKYHRERQNEALLVSPSSSTSTLDDTTESGPSAPLSIITPEYAEDREQSLPPMISPTETLVRMPSPTPEPVPRSTRAASEPSPSRGRSATPGPPVVPGGSPVCIKLEE